MPPRALLSYLAFTITAYAADTRIPVEIEDGVIYLGVSVNGSPSRPFILDTGASYTVISLQIAESLGLGLLRRGKIEGGSGDAPPESYFVTDSVPLGLPGLTFSSRNALAMSFDMLGRCFKEGAKRELGGILGKDFFDTNVVEIDYSAKLVNLYNPQTYNYRGTGTSLPIEAPGYIFINAQIQAHGRGPVGARLMVDTGASAPLTLTKEFVKDNRLLPPTTKLSELNDCGIGGVAKEKSRVGSLPGILLGGLKVPNPVTVFLQNPEATDYDGVLGGNALRAFKVIFDHPHQRMILEPLPRSRAR
jgi:predicted aspartyl protease